MVALDRSSSLRIGAGQNLLVTSSVAALIMLLFAGRVWLVAAHFSTDPDEGWNALQAMRAFGPGPLYPPPGSLTGNNYPPLSFFIVGLLGRIIGDNIVAGRLVALVSLLIVAGLIVVAARKICGTATSAPYVGGLVFLGFSATAFRSYLCMDDPQWLGHALMMVGVVLLVEGGERGRLHPGRIAIGAIMMLAGGLIKQNLVAFPLAVSIWLLHDRRSLTVWLVTSTMALLVASDVFYRLYGIAFFSDVLGAERHYSSLRMALRSAGPVALMLPMIVVSLRLLRVRRLDRRFDLLLLLVALSLPAGIAQRSGQGVDVNAHFESLIALSLATAVSLGCCGFDRAQPLLRRPATWLALPLIILLPACLLTNAKDLLDRRDREIAWSVMQKRVSTFPGRVACQTTAMCYWAGRSGDIDFFLYGQYAARHGIVALRQALAERRFSAIELDRAPGLPPPGEIANAVPDIIARFYCPVFVDDAGRRLLVPARLRQPGRQCV